MIAAIMAIVVGLITALPQILSLIEARTSAKTNEGVQRAKQDSYLLDSVLPPPPGL